MKASENCLNFIKQWEGLRLRAYKALPTEKNYTIGYGHYSAYTKKNQVISLLEADKLLREDVTLIEHKMDDFEVQLSQNQYDAIISLIYNIGWYTFRSGMIYHTMAKLGRDKEPIDCARRIVLYVRASGKIVLMLQKRRVAEANMFLGEEKFYIEDGVIKERD